MWNRTLVRLVKWKTITSWIYRSRKRLETYSGLKCDERSCSGWTCTSCTCRALETLAVIWSGLQYRDWVFAAILYGFLHTFVAPIPRCHSIQWIGARPDPVQCSVMWVAHLNGWITTVMICLIETEAWRPTTEDMLFADVYAETLKSSLAQLIENIALFMKHWVPNEVVVQGGTKTTNLIKTTSSGVRCLAVTAECFNG